LLLGTHRGSSWLYSEMPHDRCVFLVEGAVLRIAGNLMCRRRRVVSLMVPRHTSKLEQSRLYPPP